MAQAPKIDRRIVEMLENSGNAHFTVRRLRDQYANTNGVQPHLHSLLRKFIYREIKKLRRAKLIEMDEKWQKRNQQYHVRSEFSRSAVDATGEVFEEWQVRQKESNIEKATADTKSKSTESTTAAVKAEYSDELATFLESRLKKIKSEFLETVGRSEEFKLLSEGFPAFPQLAAEFREKYNETREQSLRLLGRIEAIEDVKKQRDYGR